jgi:hypothetical protein
MNLMSHVVQRMQRIPPPLTRDVVIERDLMTPMRDGAVLLADRWTPRSDGLDRAAGLVAGHEGLRPAGVAHRGEVGVADAAGRDAHQHVPRSDVRCG